MLATTPTDQPLSPPPPTRMLVPLTDELVELILIARLRSVSSRLTTTNLSNLLPPLMATTRQVAPAVTKATLNDLPWIDLDLASRVGDTALMDLMVDLERRPNGRPLQWTHRAHTEAARGGHVHVLDWWLKQTHLQVEWSSLLKPALQGGHAHVLEWWSRSGLTMYYAQGAIPWRCCAIPGIKECVLWAHQNRDKLVWEQRVENPELSEEVIHNNTKALVQNLATQSCIVDVYGWARETGKCQVDYQRILTSALKWGVTEAVDWLLANYPSQQQLCEDISKLVSDALPKIVWLRRRTGNEEVAPKPVADSGFCTQGLPDVMASSSSKGGRFGWFLESSSAWQLLTLAGANHIKRLIALAAQDGDVSLLQKLEEKGHSSLSDRVLFNAIQSGKVEMVEFVLDRMANPEIEVEACACAKCSTDLLDISTFHSVKDAAIAPILDCLVAGGISPKPDCAVQYLSAAIKSQRMPLIHWWMQQPGCATFVAQNPSALSSRLDDSAITSACESGNVAFLTWWMDRCGAQQVNFDQVLDPETVARLARYGHLGMLKLLYKHAPHLLREYSMYPQIEMVKMDPLRARAMYDRGPFQTRIKITLIDGVSSNFNPNSVESSLKVLDWWFNETDLPMYYTNHAMDSASRHGMFPILDWWLAHADKLELKYSPAALDVQCQAQQQRQGKDAVFRLDTRVLHWWARNGLWIKGEVWIAQYQCDHMDVTSTSNTVRDSYLCGNSAANLPLLMQVVRTDQEDMDHMLGGLFPILKPSVGRLLLRMCLGHYRPAWMDAIPLDLSHHTAKALELFGKLWDGQDASRGRFKHISSGGGCIAFDQEVGGFPALPMDVGPPLVWEQD